MATGSRCSSKHVDSAFLSTTFPSGSDTPPHATSRSKTTRPSLRTMPRSSATARTGFVSARYRLRYRGAGQRPARGRPSAALPRRRLHDRRCGVPGGVRAPGPRVSAGGSAGRRGGGARRRRPADGRSVAGQATPTRRSLADSLDVRRRCGGADPWRDRPGFDRQRGSEDGQRAGQGGQTVDDAGQGFRRRRPGRFGFGLGLRQ